MVIISSFYEIEVFVLVSRYLHCQNFASRGREYPFGHSRPACRDTRTRETRLTVRLRLRHTPDLFRGIYCIMGIQWTFLLYQNREKLKSFGNEFKKSYFRTGGMNAHGNRYYRRK